MFDCLAVGIGGFFGSIGRYLIGMIPIKESSAFPFNTLLINVAGAFLIGLIAASALKNQQLDPRWVLLLKVGLCGGFTTFSAFSLETVDLLRAGSYAAAFLYIVLSVILCAGAVIAGQYVIR